jgi:DNA invertase Pin-like site-specific DNA recombinase
MRSRGGDKRGNFQMQLRKNKVRNLLDCFKSDKEIMLELGIKRRTYYRYKSSLIREDRIRWQK